MEGKTPFERVIGGTDEEKKKAVSDLQESFDDRNANLAERELEKTPEDMELIRVVESLVDDIVMKYDGDPKPLPINKIFLLKPGDVSEITKGRFAGGVHRPLVSEVAIERNSSNYLFASSLAHEMFHLKSPKAARLKAEGSDLRLGLYRSGISMVDIKDEEAEFGEERVYFDDLEEAIVAECTRKFLERLRGEDKFRLETEAIDKYKKWLVTFYKTTNVPEDSINSIIEELKYIPDPVGAVAEAEAFSNNEEKRKAYAAGMFARFHKNEEIEWLERYNERKKFNEVLDELLEKSNGRFKNRDEVFDCFATANFSGKYLVLARIVESILGKGSFRRLAEKFSKKEK